MTQEKRRKILYRILAVVAAIAIVLALAASLGIHAAALFGPDVELFGGADEPLPLRAELQAPPASPAMPAAAAKPAKKAKAASVIKFRHPENASIGWTGHGRKPQWVIDWVAQGKSLDDLRADAAAVTAA